MKERKTKKGRKKDQKKGKKGRKKERITNDAKEAWPSHSPSLLSSSSSVLLAFSPFLGATTKGESFTPSSATGRWPWPPSCPPKRVGGPRAPPPPRAWLVWYFCTTFAFHHAMAVNLGGPSHWPSHRNNHQNAHVDKFDLFPSNTTLCCARY